jgi:hypothetical protein
MCEGELKNINVLAKIAITTLTNTIFSVSFLLHNTFREIFELRWQSNKI